MYRTFLRSVGLITVLIFFVPTIVFARTLPAGVPKESIWFSQDSFLEGDQITISVPLYNSSVYRFSGTLELNDGTTTIGKRLFVLPVGASQIVTFPWKAITGEHNFSVTISGGEFVSKDKSLADQPVFDGTSTVIRRFVEPKQAPAAPPPETAIEENLSEGESELTKYLSTKIPKAIVARVLPVIKEAETFRINQATRAESLKDELVAGILSASDTSGKSSDGWSVFTGGVAKGDIIYSPWEYAKLFFVLCYEFLTTNIYAFYILCFYILYVIIRFAVSFFA